MTSPQRIEIIPAIDIIGGRCVRLSQGDYDRCRAYDASPADMARRFADAGVRRLHLVDLDGAKASRPLNLATLAEVVAAVPEMEVEWGGGIKTSEALDEVFAAGARYAVVGSVAAREPELFAGWLERFGSERMVLGADVSNGRIATDGWLRTADATISDLIDRFLPLGLQQAIVTEISRDGMLAGPETDLYLELQSRYPSVTFTVSGGVSSADDIRRLSSLGLRRVIVGKAIYENHIPLSFIKQWLQNG